MEHTFISYSRKQLYFAEAIALHLQKEGIQICFDLQQLGADADWASALKEGYENCKRLILVVSQSTLASKYVEAVDFFLHNDLVNRPMARHIAQILRRLATVKWMI